MKISIHPLYITPMLFLYQNVGFDACVIELGPLMSHTHLWMTARQTVKSQNVNSLCVILMSSALLWIIFMPIMRCYESKRRHSKLIVEYYRFQSFTQQVNVIVNTADVVYSNAWLNPTFTSDSPHVLSRKMPVPAQP